VPAAAEPSAALALLLGDGDRALRVVRLQQALRRRAELLVVVNAAKTACEEWSHGVWSEGVGHALLD
jgi:hypothetical protein